MSTDRSTERPVEAAADQPILLRADRGPEELPPGHYNMTARRLFDDSKTRIQFCRMGADGHADEHTHDDENQMFVVLNGLLVVDSGNGEPVYAGRTDAVYLPAGTPHATTTGAGGATYFALTFPAR